MLPWRWLAVVGELPALLMAVMLVFMPYSPRRLLSLGRKEQAEKALRWLRGKHYDTNIELLAIQVQTNAFSHTRVDLSVVSVCSCAFITVFFSAFIAQHRHTRESHMVPAGHTHLL